MKRTKFFLSLVAVMALLVAFAAPAMADDNHHNFFRHHPFFFDRFDNGFQDFEQEADSGDIVQSFDVSQTGDNSNQCVGITGNANTGNAQNQIGLTDFGGTFNGFDRFDHGRFFDGRPFFFDGFNGGDFEFDDTGATLDVSGTSTTSCDQEVNQAAAAG